MLNLNATAAGLATDHSVSLAGLTPNTTYHYRVLSTDGAGNPATSPTASFVTPSLSLVDTTDADFLAGTGGCLVAGGGVRLAPSLSEQFSGSALPAGWTPFSWTGSGAVTVAGGAVTADGQRVTSDAVYGPGRVLEIRGTLARGAVPALRLRRRRALQRLAVGDLLHRRDGRLARWRGRGGVARWSTRRFRVSHSACRTTSGSSGTPASVVYYVDGVQVASHAETISAGMRIGLSDLNAGGAAVSVDSVSLTPYSSPCTFESRVHDAGAAVGLEHAHGDDRHAGGHEHRARRSRG